MTDLDGGTPNPSDPPTGMREVRFGDYVREVALRQRRVSFNDLARASQVPLDRAIDLQATDAAAILRPYLTPRFKEQARAVVPLAAYLALFQLVLLRQQVARSWAVTGGLLAVMVGLLLFMEGLKLGLMPLGEAIGNTLPKSRSCWPSASCSASASRWPSRPSARSRRPARS